MFGLPVAPRRFHQESTSREAIFRIPDLRYSIVRPVFTPRPASIHSSSLEIGVNKSGERCEWRAAPLGSEFRIGDSVPWSWPHRVESLRGAQMGPNATSARIARGAHFWPFPIPYPRGVNTLARSGVAFALIWAPRSDPTRFGYVRRALFTILNSVCHQCRREPAPRAPKVEGLLSKLT